MTDHVDLLPESVTMTTEDFDPGNFALEKGKFAVDPFNCPLVRAVYRAIDDTMNCQVRLTTNYVIRLDPLDSAIGLQFQAPLLKRDEERVRIYGPDWTGSLAGPSGAQSLLSFTMRLTGKLTARISSCA